MATTNPITGDKIQSKQNTKAFEDNFDAIFRKPLNPVIPESKAKDIKPKV